MSDLVAEFLEKEKEQLGDIDDFQFENKDEENQPAPTVVVNNTTMPKIEAEKIRLWKIEFNERLQKKDADEQVRKAEFEKEAVKELEDWKVHYKDQLEKKRQLNRETQGAFEQDRDQPIPGSEWQRVCKLCEFTAPKQSSTVQTVTNTKDTSRMKSILMLLRTTPLVRG